MATSNREVSIWDLLDGVDEEKEWEKNLTAYMAGAGEDKELSYVRYMLSMLSRGEGISREEYRRRLEQAALLTLAMLNRKK